MHFIASLRQNQQMHKIIKKHKICLLAETYVKVKVKVKFSLEQATKAQRGSTGIALLFL